jgi:hypothetical protein
VSELTDNPGRHSAVERGNDCYWTPPVAVEKLLQVERLPGKIWEPAAGKNAITNILRTHDYTVVASDLVNYGELDFVGDFFAIKQAPAGCTRVLTNPPFNCVDDFARHALDLVPHVFLLLRWAFYEAVCRTDILEHRGLRAIHLFRSRLPRMHREGWTGRRSNSRVAYAWYAWERDFRGPTTVNRI